MRKSDILEISRNYGLHPNKKLGQNFLYSDAVVDRIFGVAGIGADDSVLEIGPGLGAMTEKIVGIGASLTAVEIDAGIVRYLNDRFEGSGNFTLVHGDFLKTHIPGAFTKSVSNLPYYCASEILFKLAVDYAIPRVCVMLQREMAERIVSPPGEKNYGALTVALGSYYTPAIEFNVSKNCFHPQPDIVSSVVTLQARNDVHLSPAERRMFHAVVKNAFWGRRKMLITALAEAPGSSLDKKVIASILREMNLDAKIRGEDLSVGEFILLARRLNEMTDGENS